MTLECFEYWYVVAWVDDRGETVDTLFGEQIKTPFYKRES